MTDIPKNDVPQNDIPTSDIPTSDTPRDEVPSAKLAPDKATPPKPAPSKPTLRYEIWLASFFSAAWVLVFLAFAGLLPLAGIIDLDLYRLYSVAAVLGWTTGNVYMLRRSTLPGGLFGKRLLGVYGVGPLSLLFLLRAMAPSSVHAAAPFVPLYCACVFGLFFLVPVTLKATRTPRRR